MNSLLVTAVITTFVLGLFLHSGNALVCYTCANSRCDRNATCSADVDTCLIVHYSGGSMSGCWSNSACDEKIISVLLKLNNVNNYRCCNWDLCNYAPNVVASKRVLCGALLLTIIHLLKSLVGN